MTDTTLSQTLSADRPLVDPADDRLGYAPFAEHLAQSISKMAPPQGLVIAVYGSWGSGKSTLLNFVEYYLKQRPVKEQPVIMRFNPWWFSGQEDMVRRFFGQLQSIIKNRRVASAEVRRQLADFADAVSELPLPYISAAKMVAKIASRMTTDISALKSLISDALGKQNRRILVIIDDLDRLAQDEIRQVLNLVKAVADFPNVVYLIVFDREIVTEALHQVQGISGQDYLAKIVQVPYELPVPDQASLNALLFERLNAILGEDQSVDQGYWADVFLHGLQHFINTPRDVARLANTLSATYPVVKGEVNPVDFIAIEAMRVSCPGVYDTVRRHPEMFTGQQDSGFHRGVRKQELQSFHDSWLARVPEKDRDAVKHLILIVFPILASVWRQAYFDGQRAAAWRRELRACSPDKFPIYFRLAIPVGDISNLEMMNTLALAKDPDAFARRLVDLAGERCPDGTTRVRRFLGQLGDYTDQQVLVDHTPAIVTAFFDVGDQLLVPEDEQRNPYDLGNDLRMRRVIWQLLHRCDEPTRFAILRDSISIGKALSVAVREITSLGEEHGKYGAQHPQPEADRMVDSQHLVELEKLGLRKIRDAVTAGRLMQSPTLPLILHRWIDWEGEKDAKDWVRETVVSDAGLAELLEKFFRRAHAQSAYDRIPRVLGRLDPKWVESFLDPAETFRRAKAIVMSSGTSGLSEGQIIALQQYMREYELREQGKDPSDPFSWTDK